MLAVAIVTAGAVSAPIVPNQSFAIATQTADVPLSRTLHYPALQQPVPIVDAVGETVTVDKWLNVWVGPGKRKTAPVGDGLTWASGPYNIDVVWGQPLSQTGPRRYKLALGQSADPVPELVPLRAWVGADTAAPLKRRPLLSGGQAGPVYVEPPAETVTVDKWQVPLSVPVPPRGKNIATGGICPLIPSEVTVDQWLSTVTLAPRRPPTAARDSQTFVPDVAAATEVTVDQWLGQLARIPVKPVSVPLGQMAFVPTVPDVPPVTPAADTDAGWWDFGYKKRKRQSQDAKAREIDKWLASLKGRVDKALSPPVSPTMPPPRVAPDTTPITPAPLAVDPLKAWEETLLQQQAVERAAQAELARIKAEQWAAVRASAKQAFAASRSEVLAAKAEVKRQAALATERRRIQDALAAEMVAIEADAIRRKAKAAFLAHRALKRLS